MTSLQSGPDRLGREAARLRGTQGQGAQCWGLWSHGTAAIRRSTVHALQALALGAEVVLVERAGIVDVGILLAHAVLLVVEAVLDERAGHGSIIRGVGVHMRHLALVTHRDATSRLILKVVHIIALMAVLTADLEIQQLVCVDAGVSEVEAGRHVLLRTIGVRHEAILLLHGQVGWVNPIGELVTHRVTGV